MISFSSEEITFTYAENQHLTTTLAIRNNTTSKHLYYKVRPCSSLVQSFSAEILHGEARQVPRGPERIRGGAHFDPQGSTP